MNTKYNIISIFIFLLSLPTFSQQQKSAESFVNLLETHDYWKRASSSGSEAKAPIPLSELQSLNPKLQKIETYTRIHMDYGNPLKERDPNHDFTILEINFKRISDIPFANEQDIQKYPICSGSLSFEELSEAEKKQVFPFWFFKELEHGQVINWGHREYINWFGVRYKNTVFLIYTIPVARMEDIPEYAETLYDFLAANTPEKMHLFIQCLEESKSESSIAYDSVKDLQRMLDNLGFEPGPIDGQYGSKTETALIELLVKLDYLNSYQADFNQIQIALKDFQKNNNIPQTGRFEQETINMIEKVYLNL